MSFHDPKLDAPFWQTPIENLLKKMNSTANGLSTIEAKVRLKNFGPNVIHKEKNRIILALKMRGHVAAPT